MKTPKFSRKLDMIMEVSPSPEKMYYRERSKRMHLGSFFDKGMREGRRKEFALDTNHTEEEISTKEELREKTVKGIIELKMKIKEPLAVYRGRIKSTHVNSIDQSVIQTFSALIQTFINTKAKISTTHSYIFNTLLKINRPSTPFR
jgi:hypothetical protein